MCLIAFAYKVHPDYPLLLVANRDEFHARPAVQQAWWPDQPLILAGRDLQEGGTWLGLSRSGRMGAVTNVRAPDALLRRAQSRGRLITRFLESSAPAVEFASGLQAGAAEFGGYNLLLFDGRDLHYISNHPQFVSRAVEPGVHALSNAQLDTPWPKALNAHAAMRDWLARDLADDAPVLAAMANPAQAQDAALPETGVSEDMERVLSSAFINTPTYGTRCTSLLKYSGSGWIELFERRYDSQGIVSGESRERFQRE